MRFEDVSGRVSVSFGDPPWEYYFYGHAQHPDDSYLEPARWCIDNMGPVDERWAIDAPLISIRDHVDAAAFKLRWC